MRPLSLDPTLIRKISAEVSTSCRDCVRRSRLAGLAGGGPARGASTGAGFAAGAEASIEAAPQSGLDGWGGATGSGSSFRLEPADAPQNRSKKGRTSVGFDARSEEHTSE